MNTHPIIIEHYDDYKSSFGNIYFRQDKSIHPRFQNDIFKFKFSNSFSDDPRIGTGYLRLIKRYSSIKFETVFDISINTASDYGVFFSLVEVTQDGTIKLKDNYPNCCFHFSISVSKNGIDELLLHNYLMIFMRSEEISLKLSINDRLPQPKLNDDEFSIATYICGCSDELCKSIQFNGRQIVYQIADPQSREKEINKEKIRFRPNRCGKILPAIRIDQETYDFLRAPLDNQQLNAILYTNKYLDVEGKDIPETQIQKNILQNTLKRYLFFKEFEGHESRQYQEARQLVFTTDEFKEQAKQMPFLALLIFAQYDYYYRSSIVKEYKNRLSCTEGNKTRLNIKDILEELQQGQGLNRYIVNREMCRENMDIKSLLRICRNDEKADNDDLSQLKQEQIWERIKSNYSLKLHEAIISELFEAATIAEGMLQLIENAVIHASGGLLSIRIREFIKVSENESDSESELNKDTALLIQNYPALRDTASMRRLGKAFYLEMKLSDFSIKNMKEKFLDNAKNRVEHDEDLNNMLKDLQNSHGRIYSLFFDPSPEEQRFWRKYYNAISLNQVHHYGLQIFDSILKSRHGSLSISGHEDNYIPADEFYVSLNINELDEKMPGSSYRVLLPLSHDMISSNNIIIDTCSDQLMSMTDLNSYRTSDMQFKQIEIGNNMSWEGAETSSKEEIIEHIAEELKKLCDGACLLVIHLDEIIESASQNNLHLNKEIITKGLLLFLLEQSSQEGEMPIFATIVNLSPYALLEITRVISLFYDKRGETTDNMKKIQIFLRGKSLGDEILFAGSNISQTADRITRLALTRGNSSEYITIAQSLLNRSDDSMQEKING